MGNRNLTDAASRTGSTGSCPTASLLATRPACYALAQEAHRGPSPVIPGSTVFARHHRPVDNADYGIGEGPKAIVFVAGLSRDWRDWSKVQTTVLRSRCRTFTNTARLGDTNS